jgi:hypothetical protein
MCEHGNSLEPVLFCIGCATRYSPAKCIACEMKEVSGRPDPKQVSTSFVERQNWIVRTTLRRYTRLSNGFSRKLENHAAAVANYFAYNFIKIHRMLCMSPAIAAGVGTRLWSVEDLVALWESYKGEGRKSGVMFEGLFRPIYLLVIVLINLLVITPCWRIFKKIGFNPWLSILMLIPLVNLITLWYVAFATGSADNSK